MMTVPKNTFSRSDLKLESWPPPAMRGMRVGVSKAMKVTHTPTGLYVVENSYRSQYENKFNATLQLEEEVTKYYEENEDA